MTGRRHPGVTPRTPPRILVRVLFCILFAAAQTACSRAPDKAYKTQIFTLGTVVDISLWDVDEKHAAEAVKVVETTLNDVHNRWHAWQPSELTRINAGLAAGETLTVSEDVSALLQLGVGLARQSGELFNPAIGRLIGLWGFHSDDLPVGPPPAQDLIDGLLQAAPTMEDLRIENDRIGSANRAVELDVGAYAKGYAVDRAIEALQRLGIRDAIVNAGGDLRAIGSHGKRPWRIGIRQPEKTVGIIASIETHGDESVFTSGNYERYYDYQGVRYHHIIDPRTGYPARDTVSVTVISDVGAAADAASTALFVAGPREWPAIARRMGISQVMLIDADMKVYMTPAMAKRVHFEVDPAPEVILSDPS